MIAILLAPIQQEDSRCHDWGDDGSLRGAAGDVNVVEVPVLMRIFEIILSDINPSHSPYLSLPGGSFLWSWSSPTRGPSDKLDGCLSCSLELSVSRTKSTYFFGNFLFQGQMGVGSRLICEFA